MSIISNDLEHLTLLQRKVQKLSDDSYQRLEYLISVGEKSMLVMIPYED